MATKEPRGANWAFLVYPESARDGWMDILSCEDVNILISPLHNPDKVTVELDQDQATGMQLHHQIRKPHYHVQILFGEGANKSLSQVKEIADKVNGVHPIKLASKEGYAKYLLHLGRKYKHKQQWEPGTMPTIFGDVDYYELISNSVDVRENLKDMVSFIGRNDVNYLYELADYSATYNSVWFDIIATKRTIFLDRYISSRRTAKKDGMSPYDVENTAYKLNKMEEIYRSSQVSEEEKEYRE